MARITHSDWPDEVTKVDNEPAPNDIVGQLRAIRLELAEIRGAQIAQSEMIARLAALPEAIGHIANFLFERQAVAIRSATPPPFAAVAPPGDRQ